MADRELSSWTEIATYLGVSIRTAQIWEKECGLPVRRIPGRNRVIAYASDFDAWKLSRNNQAQIIGKSLSSLLRIGRWGDWVSLPREEQRGNIG